MLENFLNQSNSFEDMSLNVDTNKKSEFRTFAGCPPAGVAKINITDRFLVQLIVI